MNDKFDELTKSLAQSVTRRAALKRFGVGLAGMAMASFGLASKAAPAKGSLCSCSSNSDCPNGYHCLGGECFPNWCNPSTDPCCCYKKGKACATGVPACDPLYYSCSSNCSAITFGGGTCPVG